MSYLNIWEKYNEKVYLLERHLRWILLFLFLWNLFAGHNLCYGDSAWNKGKIWRSNEKLFQRVQNLFLEITSKFIFQILWFIMYNFQNEISYIPSNLPSYHYIIFYMIKLMLIPFWTLTLVILIKHFIFNNCITNKRINLRKSKLK